jgi:hypothetical protein
MFALFIHRVFLMWLLDLSSHLYVFSGFGLVLMVNMIQQRWVLRYKHGFGSLMLCCCVEQQRPTNDIAMMDYD